MRSEGEGDLDGWRQIVSRPYPPAIVTQLADCSEKAREAQQESEMVDILVGPVFA